MTVKDFKVMDVSGATLIPVFIDPELVKATRECTPIQALIPRLSDMVAEYRNPVHKFINRMETTFENFCNWLRWFCR